jgi:hypothetical protein
MRKRPKKTSPPTRLIHEWKLPTAVTLGSTVRAKGILLEVRAHLSPATKRLVDVETGALALRVPKAVEDNYESVVETVSRTLNGIEDLPVIPREVEDILSISSAERHRWLKDGRLQSAGTRTVKLRGRSRKITFHVLNPRHIEDMLDRNMPEVWREDDAQTAIEKRRRAAAKAALTRAGTVQKKASLSSTSLERHAPDLELESWQEFDPDGLLR